MKAQKITIFDTLKAVKAINREVQHMPKKMVFIDKKKQRNKMACRTGRFE